MIETTVKCVIREPLTSRYVLLLETLCGHYLIPVNVGDFEAESIYCVLNRINTPRPMTYEFIARILDSIEDANIDRVLWTDMRTETIKPAFMLCAINLKSVSTADLRTV